MRSIKITIFLSLLSFLVLPSPTDAIEEKPNFLLILADDLGYSDLGCFGGEISTPNIDALATNGIRLTRLYNTGRCCPSRASLLTGQYPHKVGLGHMAGNDLGHPGFAGRVSPEAQTIAQALAPAGYRSFLAGKWHLGTEDPTKHGFEEFYGTLVSAKRFWDPDHFLRLPKDRKARSYETGKFHGTDALTDHAIDFLSLARETPEKPWFLYLAYNAPHFPLHAWPSDIAKYTDRYQVGWDAIRAQRLARLKKLDLFPNDTKLPPRSPWSNYGETESGVNPAWDTLSPDRQKDLARRMAIYAAMIEQMDRNIGRVITDLKTTDQLENTVILFTTDNGACAEWDPNGFDIKSSNQNILHTGKELKTMGSEGTFHSIGSGWANASNTPFRLYKHFNHEGGIASPGIIHWPAGIDDNQKGKLERTPLHLIDVLPTFMNLSGLTHMEMPGKSFSALLNQNHSSGENTQDRPLFFEHEAHRAVIHKGMKLVAIKDQPWELYDLTSDPTEQENHADAQPELVQKMEALWNNWADKNQVTPLPKDLGVKYVKVRE